MRIMFYLYLEGKNVFQCFWSDPKTRVFECFWVSLCILDGKIVFQCFWSDPKTRVFECFPEVLYCYCFCFLPSRPGSHRQMTSFIDREDSFLLRQPDLAIPDLDGPRSFTLIDVQD